MDNAVKSKAIAIVYGPAGTGKTFALEALALAEVSYLHQGEPTDLSVDRRKGRGFRPFEGSRESAGWYDL